MKTATRIGIALSATWVSVFAIIVLTNLCGAVGMLLNEWGDFLAGFSAPLALLCLVVGYFQQGEELCLNTDAQPVFLNSGGMMSGGALRRL